MDIHYLALFNQWYIHENLLLEEIILQLHLVLRLKLTPVKFDLWWRSIPHSEHMNLGILIPTEEIIYSTESLLDEYARSGINTLNDATVLWLFIWYSFSLDWGPKWTTPIKRDSRRATCQSLRASLEVTRDKGTEQNHNKVDWRDWSLEHAEAQLYSNIK